MVKSGQPDAITLLAPVGDHRCAKHISLVNGRVDVAPYGNARTWNATAAPAGSLRDLYMLLKDNPRGIIVYGALTDEAVTCNIPRRKENPGASLKDCDRSWLALDIDGLTVESTKATEMIQEAVKTLPAPFHDASYVWQYTSSYGLTGDMHDLRCRIFFMLSEPVLPTAWRHFFREQKHVDGAIYTCNQPIYYNSPTFDGVDNPVSGSRVGTRKGPAKCVDVPSLNIEEALAEAKKAATVGNVVDRLDVDPDERQIEEAIEKIRGQTPSDSRHNWITGAVCELYALGTDPQVIQDVCEECMIAHGREPDAGEVIRQIKFAAAKSASGTLRTSNTPISLLLGDLPDEDPTAEDLATKQIETEESDDGEISLGYHPGELVSDRTDSTNAHAFVAGRYGDTGFLRWAELDYCWDGKNWREMESEELEGEVAQMAGPDLSSAKVTSVVKTIRRVFQRPGLDLPCWLTNDNRRADTHTQAINFLNGVVHVEDAMLDAATALVPHERRYFTINALPFNYAPEATCPRFEQCLGEWFPGDTKAHREIQKVLGYMLVPDNRYEKMFVLTGESRAGKGVLTKVIGDMLGAHNCAATSLTSLAAPHALAGFVGKPVCFINEANAQHRRDVPQEAVDRLKMITGSDKVEVNPKHRSLVYMELPTRFILTANQMPRMDDASGAILRRMHLFDFQHSFFGREDFDLKATLRSEMPGIINFALRGLGMLYNEDKGFKDIDSAAELKDEIVATSSPARAFAATCVEYTRGAEPIPTDHLFDTFRAWADDQGLIYKPAKNEFIKQVKKTHGPSTIWTPSKGTDRPGNVVGLKYTESGLSFADGLKEWVDA